MGAVLVMDVVTMEMHDEHENRTAHDHTDSLVLMTHIETSRLWYVVACGAGEDAQKAEGGDVNVSWIILILTFSFFMFLRSIISVACCVKAKTMGKPMVTELPSWRKNLFMAEWSITIPEIVKPSPAHDVRVCGKDDERDLSEMHRIPETGATEA